MTQKLETPPLCPWCAHEPYGDLHTAQIMGSRTGHNFAIACRHCEASAPGAKTMAEAWENWAARADLAREQVAAAYEDAAAQCADQFAAHMTAAICGVPGNSRSREAAANMAERLLHRIRNRTPADASAALDALLHQALAERAEAMREAAANECAIIVKASSLEVGNPEFRAGKVNAARKLHDRIRAIDPAAIVQKVKGRGG